MPVESLSFESLGSSCHLFGAGVERVRQWVESMHGRLTRFEPESELSRFNSAAGSWVDVSAELEQLLTAALRAFEMSGGLVNAAVLPALEAAGYRRTLSAGPGLLATERQAPLDPLPEVLEVGPGRARLRPGAGIDLGGIAKGWLADRATERLGPHGLANLGGDLFARGEWPVGFGGRTLLLEDQGAATSGTWRRRWEGGHHLVDPRTGRPSATDLSEVSVVAATGFEAEVHAKTALLLSSAGAPPYLATNCAAWAIS